MAIFGFVMLAPAAITLYLAGLDFQAFLSGLNVNFIVVIVIISIGGLAFISAGVRGVIKGRTPNPGVVDELNDLGR